jgi:hypothetical protein
MCEQIFAAVIGRNKAEAFGIVKPLHRPCCHILIPRLETRVGCPLTLFENQARVIGLTGAAVALKPNTPMLFRPLVW